MSKIRIVDKTTVYVIGLSPNLIESSVIRRFEYFGQYGQIQKVLVKTREFIGKAKETDSDSSKLPSYGAHITYATPEEASLAILALDKHVFDGRKIRASFGRTKFCKYFLQSLSCPQRDACPYLHKDVKECDVLTPDDMQAKDDRLYAQSIQIAIKVSKICEMNELQFKNFLQHRRELLCHKKPQQYVLPRVESIFDNEELIKQVLAFRKPTARKRRRRKRLELVPLQRSNSAQKQGTAATASLRLSMAAT